MSNNTTGACESNKAWTPYSWRGLPILQQPVYENPDALAKASGELMRLPGIVSPIEVVRSSKLKKQLLTI